MLKKYFNRQRFFAAAAVLALVVLALGPAMPALADTNWTLSGNNIYNNNPGNIGVGTPTPAQKLEVDGGLLVQIPSTGTSTSSTYPNGFSYSRAITIDHTKVSNTDQVNFPVLLSVIDPTLKTIANGGHVQSASGNDIIFTSDASGSSLLSWEVEKYDGAAGSVVAWVKIPVLSHTTDTVIYMYYGNPTATDQSNKTAVWDSNYRAVYHLPNGNTLTATDSTLAANNLTQNGSPSATAGQIDGAARFATSTSDYFSCANANCGGTGKLDMGTKDWTVEFWLKTAQANGPIPIAKTGFLCGSDSGWMGSLSTLGRLSGTFGSGSTCDISPVNDGTAVNDNNWHLVDLVWNRASNMLRYVDGAVSGTSYNIANLNNVNISTTQPFCLGARCPSGAGAQFFQGSLDEVKISAIARSADWIKTEYNNQSNPASFAALGAEQIPTTLITTYVPALLVNSSGLVGIGNASPSQALDVTGNVKLSGSIVSDGDICIGTCQ